MTHNAKEVNAEELFELLRSISKFIERKTRMYALGGTALTILSIKASTGDIDINIGSKEEYGYICKIARYSRIWALRRQGHTAGLARKG